MSDILKRVATLKRDTDTMIVQLKLLRSTARRSVPEWVDCINVSMTEDVDLATNWDVVLNALAGKLVHSCRPALEMAIASPEPGIKAIWVRTG